MYDAYELMAYCQGFFTVSISMLLMNTARYPYGVLSGKELWDRIREKLSYYECDGGPEM